MKFNFFKVQILDADTEECVYEIARVYKGQSSEDVEKYFKLAHNWKSDWIVRAVPVEEG